MDYMKIYNSIITKRKNTPISNGVYREKHHIIPRCLGGKDILDNIVELTAKEHYVAHHLLYKHYKTSKLAHAWFSMLRRGPNQERNFTAKQYEMAKNAHVQSLRNNMSGENNPFYGKTHSKETRKRLSESVSAWHKNNPISEKNKDNWVSKVAKTPASAKQKSTVSEINKNKITLKTFTLASVLELTSI